jgi:hypothetical protein
MKRFLFFISLLLIVSSLSNAQIVTALAADSSYATNDTTAWTRIGTGGGDLSLVHWFKDSVNVTIAVDYRIANCGVNVFATYNVVSDSTNCLNANGCFLSYVLKKGSTNNIPGATYIRERITRKTTGNGVTSPTYDSWLTRE